MIKATAMLGEATAGPSSGGVNVTLDIAAMLSALLWPALLLILFVKYRREFPALAKWLAGRVTKLEFGGVSIELAKATAFVPQWSEATGALDLRHKATAVQVNDSTAMTFRTQLMEQGTGDYAEVNLGAGEEWLTSRLYIMAIVFARMKGIKCFVFLETSGDVRRRYVCWAEPEKVRWALARRFPWLEQAYADAYSTILSQQQAFIVSNAGKLGFQFSQNDPGPSLALLREYLQRLQTPPPAPMPAASNDWVLIDPTTQTYERAHWITGQQLEEMLGEDAKRTSLSVSELRSKSTAEQLKMVLSVPDRFVAVTAENQRFEYLVDRNKILEQVARSLSSEQKGQE